MIAVDNMNINTNNFLQSINQDMLYEDKGNNSYVVTDDE